MRTTHRSHRSIPARSTFAGFRFPPDVIVLAVRWYLRFGLSYRDVEELLAERGIEVDHVTIYRWVLRFTPLLAEAARPCRHAVGDRWQVDETYVKVTGQWRLRVPRDRPVWAGHRRVRLHAARCHGRPSVL
jgi:IS6 family transposase